MKIKASEAEYTIGRRGVKPSLRQKLLFYKKSNFHGRVISPALSVLESDALVAPFEAF